MVWVYDRTGSLLVATLMHFSLTASTLSLGPRAISGGPFLAYVFATGGRELGLRKETLDLLAAPAMPIRKRAWVTPT